MTKLNTYVVPNYYKNFKCKGRDCRSSCCIGWDVTISMREFLQLQSLDCSIEIKNTIENSLIMNSYPTSDRYGKLAKNENKDCNLHMKNGLCYLHSNFGEDILPLICQYYP